ncbi:hypothetical protein DN757_18585 [Paenibacillus silvae]|uniref:Uncharacterized protein n=1 Tax=Paenibacillus silvae TaxID=1325358 RepID=A0A2W6NEJ2_9BACL|nr:hypothetical protein DN757_18585 [Paenibacillus silvae]
MNDIKRWIHERGSFFHHNVSGFKKAEGYRQLHFSGMKQAISPKSYLVFSQNILKSICIY